MSRLKHLALVPRGGLGNRIRAIASAKRLCALHDARCTVVWDWGDYHRCFGRDPVLDWIPALTAEMQERWHGITHLHSSRGGNKQNRRVPVSRRERIVLVTNYTFNAREEPAPIEEEELRDWLPDPAMPIRRKATEFKAAHFRRTVGMHMRRTDHFRATRGSPDALYVAEARRVVARGGDIFLATDNESTVALMKRKFGRRIIIYPKRSNLASRWPRRFRLKDTIDDLVDMHLLASCEYVIGSIYSSYSRIAMLYNGSPRCKALKTFEPDEAAL